MKYSIVAAILVIGDLMEVGGFEIKGLWSYVVDWSWTFGSLVGEC
jgi:hypothetical protein